MDEQSLGAGTQAATPEQDLLSAKISTQSKPGHIADRYELQGELAKGGMGVVQRGWDHVLHRSVAVKLLLDHAATPLGIKRFNHEAHITGQLQHPSIPPVHDLGTIDGKPFLVMKLIQGETLEHHLKTRQKLNVLAIFESIAQAIGYAHSRGVIHRDLKPLNIMVGAFGEVQVMDWGLAKFLTDANATTTDSGQSVFHDPRETDADSQTTAGAIMGTPQYMPPEQAIGANHTVNEQSDVFGLGGVLCAMLTGKPPFLATDGENTRQLAAQGKLQDAFARLDACGAEPDVIALTKRCLAVAQAERPANGNAVATIVAQLRADADERAKNAELGQARADTRRRVLAWSAAVVMAVLSTGIVVSLLLRNQAIQAELQTSTQLAKTLEAERATAEQLLKTQAEERRALTAETTAKAKTKEVEQTLAVVSERTKQLGDAYGDFVFGIQNKLQNEPGTQELRRELLSFARNGLQKILKDARKQGKPDTTLVWSYFRLGDIEQQLGNTLAAKNEFQRGYELAKQLDDADPMNLDSQRDLSISFEKLGNITLLLGDVKGALVFYEKRLLIGQRLAAQDPTDSEAQRDLSVSFLKLGDVTLQLGNAKGALKYYEQGLAVREQQSALDTDNTQAQRDVGVSLNAVGDARLKLGDAEAARSYFEKALEVSERLTEVDPTNPEAQRDLSVSFEKLGGVTLKLGELKDARKYFEQGLLVRERAAADDPTNTIAKRDLSISYENLGDVTMKLGDPNAAYTYYQQSLEVSQRLASVDANNAQAQRDLGVSLNKLGDVTLKLGNVNDAVKHYRKSLSVSERLAELDPDNAQSQRDLLVSFFKLGIVSQIQLKYADAIDWHQKALTIAKNSPTPEFYTNEIKTLQGLIDDCKMQLESTKPRERAPTPRVVK